MPVVTTVRYVDLDQLSLGLLSSAVSALGHGSGFCKTADSSSGY
jgi:hypothetical protein